MSTGQVLHYKVSESNVYPTNAFPGETVFHETGKQYLKIITCHGTFVPSLGTYNQRLVVTAELVV
jgi:sortase (surface protein transpeptidase)